MVFGFCSLLFFTALFHSAFASDEAGALKGGTQCDHHYQCYSGVCYKEFNTSHFCAPDGPLNGTMAAGSACTSNSQCFSNYCFNRTCAPDSRLQGKVAAGGMCSSNAQCFSGYCRGNRCQAESLDAFDNGNGYLAAGSECEVHEQCYSGYCHSSRCGPDGRRRNIVPSGGACSYSSQCSSHVCYGDRCSPESHNANAKGKVALGGRCKENQQCPPKSQCEDDTCSLIPKVKSENGDANDDDDDDDENGDDEDNDRPVKEKPGGRCSKIADCIFPAPCVFNRCSPPSPVNNSLIADGGRCLEDLQCASSQCHGEVCSVSYAPLSVTGWVAAGSYCRENRDCFSFLCVQGKCSSDSFAEDPRTRYPHVPELHANRVAAGGICNSDGDCYSDLCYTSTFVCSSDGPQVRTVAPGAFCSSDSDCSSGYCWAAGADRPRIERGRCIVGGETPGRVAPGGRCKTSDMCAPGSMCVDAFCKRPKDYLRRQTVLAASVHWGGVCWTDAQCAVGRCLARQCRVPAYLIERWSGAKCKEGSLVIVALSCVTLLIVRRWL